MPGAKQFNASVAAAYSFSVEGEGGGWGCCLGGATQLHRVSLPSQTRECKEMHKCVLARKNESTQIGTGQFSVSCFLVSAHRGARCIYKHKC